MKKIIKGIMWTIGSIVSAPAIVLTFYWGYRIYYVFAVNVLHFSNGKVIGTQDDAFMFALISFILFFTLACIAISYWTSTFSSEEEEE